MQGKHRKNIASDTKTDNFESAASFSSNVSPKDGSQKSANGGKRWGIFSYICLFWQHLQKEKGHPRSSHKAKGLTDSIMLTLLPLYGTPRHFHFTSSLYHPHHHPPPPPPQPQPVSSSANFLLLPPS